MNNKNLFSENKTLVMLRPMGTMGIRWFIPDYF